MYFIFNNIDATKTLFFNVVLVDLEDAALLTRCYTQHAIHPFLDSEANHRRHFIKIPSNNKGIVVAWSFKNKRPDFKVGGKMG